MASGWVFPAAKKYTDVVETLEEEEEEEMEETRKKIGDTAFVIPHNFRLIIFTTGLWRNEKRIQLGQMKTTCILLGSRVVAMATGAGHEFECHTFANVRQTANVTRLFLI